MKIVKSQLPAPPPPPATFLLELSERELADLANLIRLAIDHRMDMMRRASPTYGYDDHVVIRAENYLGILRSV